MTNQVFFSPRVMDTINALPADERRLMASALTSEFMLGTDPRPSMSGIQHMVYAIIRFYAKQDMARMGQCVPIISLNDL